MRPEGFKNPHLYFGSPHTEFDIIANGKHEAFEAGADAYEEGIWKMAKESPTGTFTFDTHTINCPSVYISEER